MWENQGLLVTTPMVQNPEPMQEQPPKEPPVTYFTEMHLKLSTSKVIRNLANSFRRQLRDLDIYLLR